MAMIKINDTAIKDPSSMSWGISDESSEESGRSTNNGKMTKDVIAQKIKLSLSWNNPSAEEVSNILKAVNYTTVGSMFSVTYLDAMENAFITKTFYVGDRSAPMKKYKIGNTVYSALSFDLIEQ
jgi:hypothetical protein